MYFSEIECASPFSAIRANLMTTFSIRNASDNTKLSKSEPAAVENEVQALRRFPAFGNEYRLVKKKVLDTLIHEDLTFSVSDEVLFETEYELNPFYDINGVNLLYFAAYPIINDVCEARYFNETLDIEWEQSFHTSYKDVFYYANCNYQDRLIYQLNSVEDLGDDRYKISSTLRRKSDGNIIARLFTVKSRINS